MIPRSTIVVIVAFSALSIVRELIYWSNSANSRNAQQFQPGLLASLRVNSSLPVAMQSSFCPGASASQSFLRRFGLRFRWNGPLGPMRASPDPNYREQRELMRDERWWCDKFPVDLSPYPQEHGPHPLSNDDVVVGVFSGENVAFTRGVAVRDTWLQRFPRSYIFTEISNSAVPTVGMREVYPQFRGGTGEVNLWGLKYMIDQNPDSKWYHIIGCDTWVDDDRVREMLSQYDSSKDVWLSPGYFLQDINRQLPNTANLAAVAKGYPKFSGSKIYWYSGAIGYWLSNSVARAYSADLAHFQSFFPNKKFSNAPDVDIGALLTFLGFTPTTMDIEYRRRMTYSAVDVDDKRVPDEWRRKGKDATLLHFIHPMRMYALEQYRLHQKVDRLVNAGDWNKVLTFFHEVIDAKAQSQRANAIGTRYMHKHPLAGKFRPGVWWDIPESPGETPEAPYNITDEVELAISERRRVLKSFRRAFGPLAKGDNVTAETLRLSNPTKIALRSRKNSSSGPTVVAEAVNGVVNCCCLVPAMKMTRCVPNLDVLSCKNNGGVCLNDSGLTDYCCCNTINMRPNVCTYAIASFCAQRGNCLTNGTLCQGAACLKKPATAEEIKTN